MKKALDGLPETYGQIKAAARATGVHTIAKLTNTLLSSDNDMEQKGTDLKSLHTVAKHQRRNNHAQANHYNKRRRCKPNRHFSDECWILHPELKPITRSQRSQAREESGNQPQNDQAQRAPAPDDVDTSHDTSRRSPHQQRLCPHECYTQATCQIPRFSGTGWIEFKEQFEMQYQLMRLKSYLYHEPDPTNDIENEKKSHRHNY